MAYVLYAKCVELGIPVFVTVGIAGPRLPSMVQHVERIDEVMYDFPDLMFVMRHGAEPWVDLAVKLMLKWPNLYYSTSAFSPRHYPQAIIDYANTRGADHVIYGGYFPMGLSLDRIVGGAAGCGVQGRGVAQVPPPQRGQGARPRRLTVSSVRREQVLQRLTEQLGFPRPTRRAAGSTACAPATTSRIAPGPTAPRSPARGSGGPPRGA